MTDNFENNSFNPENEQTASDYKKQNDYSEEKASDIANDYNTDNNTQDNAQDNTQDNDFEGSYEWNSNRPSNSEYHYSYVNGNNSYANHNPNRYNGYNEPTESNPYSYNKPNYNSTNSTSYTNPSYTSYANQNGYNGYSNNGSYGRYSNAGNTNAHPYQSHYDYRQKPVKVKAKKQSKPASKGFVALILIISVVLSGAIGFGGGFIANSTSNSSSGNGVNINQVLSDDSSTTSNEALNGTTTGIVKKTADSVVEIVTEQVVTGSFAQQYVQQGAGSGVIISEDGYIITNYHVIEGANSITVTLRDSTTSYTATLIGADEEQDIALIKVDAKGLSPATFGDSGKLAVGDYVVAIGNPLGKLGGTVTDGIISALAREVNIEGNSMTLLQHNAQISPGNSGGGLFNANGELIGIVNAKNSATEVEGIAFAIPINNVLDIIDDLKTHGYVTGKIDLEMQFVDITSRDTAFYYGVSKMGCYVLSVTNGSNAYKAGFKRGDLITQVNSTDVSTNSDIKDALKDFKVGDTVKFTVYRNGETKTLSLVLAEYTPSESNSNSSNNSYNDNGYSIWDDMLD